MSDRSPYVADASVWINLAATGRAYDIAQTLSRPLLITSAALEELDRGRTKGRLAADEVATLIHLDVVQVVEVPESSADLFYNLVSGSASQTLDDGEAATLSYAAATAAIAIIDERKATAIAKRLLPQVQLLSTTDLLLDSQIASTMGRNALIEMITAALKVARMRIFDERMEEIVELLGQETAASCLSLPAAIRNRLGQ